MMMKKTFSLITIIAILLSVNCNFLVSFADSAESSNNVYEASEASEVSEVSEVISSEKRICPATLDDDFADDCVLVVINV